MGATAGLSVVLAGCIGNDGNGGSGGDDGGGDESPQTIEVPGLYDLSGATASVGRPTALGTQDALQYLADNDELRVNIKHPTTDYAYKVPEAVSTYNDWTSGENPPAILGWGSGDTKALGPKVAQDKVVYISASYAERLLADNTPYNFFGNLDYTSQMRVLLRYLEREDPGASVGYVGPGGNLTTDPMGGPLPNYAEQVDVEFDTDPVTLPHTASSATSQMQEIKSRGWDYAMYHGIASPYNLLMKARQEVYPEVQTLSTTWCVDESWVNETPDLYEGQIWVNEFKTFNEAVESDAKGGNAVQTALEEYRDDPGPEVANLHYVRGFIHTLLLRQGLHNALDMDLDPSKGADVREGILDISDWGVWGLSEPFSFFENDRRPTMRGRVYEMSDGEINYQETIELERNMEWIEYWNEELD